jgi:hypothetical protein
MHGKITNLSIGDDGTLWCVDDSQRIWGRAANMSNWVQQPNARAIQLAVARQDQIWLMNVEGDIYQREGTNWIRQAGLPRAMDISAGSDGTAWAVDLNQGLWYRTHVNRNWQQDPGARAVRMAVSSQQHVWCLNAQGDIYKRESGVWVLRKQNSGATALDVGSDGAVWYVGTAGQLYRPSGTDWIADPLMKTALWVSVRSLGEICVLTLDGTIWQLKNGKWDKVILPVQPAPPAKKHKVKKGETLSSIAAAYKVTVDQILKANPQIKDPNLIGENQEITIPTV